MAAPTAATLTADHEVLVNGCGLLDRSERGRLALSGPDAAEFLNGQVTNELLDLTPGQGRYATFLTHKGKMLGDLRVLAVAGEGGMELLLDTERVALQGLFDMIRRFKVGYRVELHKRTLESGQLSLIGPRSEQLLALAPGPTEHENVAIELAGVPVLAIRTDLGLDLLCDAAGTATVATALRQAGAQEVSEAAAQCLRVESGRPRFGIDMDESTIPQEAGLNERAVSFTKGCYVGQETVARLFYKGRPNRHLRGLLLSAPAQTGDELLLEGRQVGRLGSVALSPALGPIGLALVRREAEPGARLAAGDGGTSARLVALPFAGD